MKNKSFGLFAKLKRVEAELSQDDVAQALGFKHRANIHKLEANKLEWKLDQVVKLAQLLGLRVGELVMQWDEWKSKD
jgi:DNA-binding XRE family transcriptional regulator